MFVCVKYCGNRRRRGISRLLGVELVYNDIPELGEIVSVCEYIEFHKLPKAIIDEFSDVVRKLILASVKAAHYSIDRFEFFIREGYLALGAFFESGVIRKGGGQNMETPCRGGHSEYDGASWRVR